MKKIFIILGVIAVLFVGLILLTSQADNKKKEDNAEILAKYGDDKVTSSTIDIAGNENYQDIISRDEMKAYANGEKDGIVYFFSPECSHCKEFTPVLMPLVKEKGIEIGQYNVLVFTDGFKEYNVVGTPTLRVYEDGKVVDELVGAYPKADTEAFLDKYKK